MSYNIYQKIVEKQRKEKEQRIGQILDRILNVMEGNKVSLEEMGDVCINLQANYYQMLVAELNNKQNAGTEQK